MEPTVVWGIGQEQFPLQLSSLPLALSIGISRESGDKGDLCFAETQAQHFRAR